MVVDGGVFGYQLGGLFEMLGRRGVLPQPVARPAEAVEDVAILRAQLDRFLDHLEAAIEVLAAIHPGIA